MSDKVSMTTTSCNDDDDDDFVRQRRPPWMLANFFPICSEGGGVNPAAITRLPLLLPGPFCVLQGSPGDGMTNTLDSMPMLPLASMNSDDISPPYYGNQNRRRSSTANSSLHPLEEVADEEANEDGAINTARPHSPAPLDDSRIMGRERSDSLTGGGLHYPLGEKSPIMQRRVGITPSLTSNLMQQRHLSSSSQQQSGFFEGRGDSSVASTVDADSSISTSSTNSAAQLRQNNKSKEATATATSLLSTPEILSIHRWQREVSQQTQLHLEERNQNIKSLLDRRKRSLQQHRQQLLRERSMRIPQTHDDIYRNLSHVADFATVTSASSSSNGSADDDGSSSRSSSPASSTTPLPSPSTTCEVGGGKGGGGGADEEENSIDEHINLLELEVSHRSWYQKDGRLIVFKSLPYMSSSGKVVAHPIITFDGVEEGEGNEQRRDGEKGMILMIAPGTTVMAEEAITLDSRSLKILHSTAAAATKSSAMDSNGNCADSVEQKQQQRHRKHYGRHRNSATLCFLRTSSPHIGYILSHIHNYPYLAPGLPTTYTGSTWLWRVTCQPDGAFIRSGLDLVAEHIGTLPYGTICCVQKKVVNYMGLNRLQIDAFVNHGEDGNDDRDSVHGEPNESPFVTAEYKKLSGYISEFLNPLSGQRGNIVEQVSFPVPALYRVIHPDGAIIRSGVELSTGQIGFAPKGSVLSIVGRSYSSNPSSNCIERLRLAGGGGWISSNLNRDEPHNKKIVEMIGADETFDPEDPASFHFDQQKKVMAELKADTAKGEMNLSSSSNNGGAGGTSYLPRRRSTANLSEIGEDDQISIPDSDGNGFIAACDFARANILASPSRQRSTAATVPTLFQRSGVVGGMIGGLFALDAVRESSSDNHRNDNANRCLICLSE
jgi:hypothetical protein